jgi:hypothetical protein
VYVGREGTIFATIQENSDWISTAARFLELELPWINILPQIGPLLTEEYRLTDERVVANMNSRLSSRHFCNQLMRMDTLFAEFKSLAEETWHGLSIEPITEAVTKDGTLVSLPVRDGDFVAEVAGWDMGCKCGFRQSGFFLEPRRTPPWCSMNQTFICVLIFNVSYSGLHAAALDSA